MKPHARLLSASVTLALVVLAGCGDNPYGKVSGKVTYQGQAVPGGMVVFTTEDTLKTERVPIQSDGTYMSSNVPLGNLKVAVEPAQKGASANMPRDAVKPESIPKDSPAAKVYANKGADYVDIPMTLRNPLTSNIILTVKPGSQTFDIPLKDDK